MSLEVLYYSPHGDSVKKHILFLEQSEFTVTKVYTKVVLELKVNTLKPLALLLTDENQIIEILSTVGEIPIVVLTKMNRNIHEVTQNLPEVPNPIFFRSELDHIDTLYETLTLIERLRG